MRVSRQHAVKVAAGAVVLCLGIASIGCDSREADRKAMKAMQGQDWQAAAREKGASANVAAIAAGRAADEQFASAVPTYRKLAQTQLAYADALWAMGRMSSETELVAASSGYLTKYNPQAAEQAWKRTMDFLGRHLTG